MLNFELYNPTNYIFGKGQIEKLSKLVPKNAKILLAYGGGSIFKNGIHEQVIRNLQGFDIIEFGGIEPTPRFETLMTAVEIVRKEKITFNPERGGIVFFCHDCNALVETDRPDTKKMKFLCSVCKGRKISYGTEESLKEHYKRSLSRR